MSTALDVLGYIGLAFGVLLLLAVALAVFAAAQVGGHGALAEWLNRPPVDLDAADRRLHGGVR